MKKKKLYKATKTIYSPQGIFAVKDDFLYINSGMATTINNVSMVLPEYRECTKKADFLDKFKEWKKSRRRK